MRRLVCIIILLASGTPATAAALDIQHFRPNTDGLGYLRLDGGATLSRNTYAIGLSQNWDDHPLEFGRIASGRRLDNVVNGYWGWDLWGAVGLLDNLEIGMDLPFSLLTSLEPLTSIATSHTVSMGDMQLRAKWRLLSPENNSAGIGLALAPFFNFPSGSSGDFYGDTSVSGGFRTAVERRFGTNLVTINLGFRARDKETIVASGLKLLAIDEEFLFGAGWKMPISSVHQLWLLSEINGSTMFANEATTPVEWDAAIQKRFWDQKWAVTFGGGFGLTHGYGSPDFRIQTAIRYVPVLPGKVARDETPQEKSPAQLEAGRIVILKPIPFAVNKSVLLPEAAPVLDAVADLLSKQKKIKHVEIEGHTDSDGSDKRNLKLSQARAEAVKNYLTQKGIETNRLEAKGWGETQPVLPNTSQENKSKNRRVEFHVVKVEE